jgi:hypothetical protein
MVFSARAADRDFRGLKSEFEIAQRRVAYFPQVEEAIWSEFPGPFFTT